MFKNAFAAYNLSDTQTVTLSPNNSVTIREVNVLNQSYNAAVSQYSEANKLTAEKMHTMLTDYTNAVVTPETVAFLTQVVITDSALTNDAGESVAHDISVLTEQFLAYPRAAQVVMNASMTTKTFQVELGK